jgi:D-alanyl-D-alanine carboxypeptidase
MTSGTRNAAKKKNFSILSMPMAVVVALALSVFITALPFKSAQANPRYASIVMDADTGMILHQRYANKRLHPASLTKVMTLLMVFEAMERGEIRLNDRIYISKHAANMVPSKLGLEPGSSIRVRDAISAIVTKSANDIAVAIAEHIAGSEDKFARQMTVRARQIGMSNTLFKNASGLHDPGQVSTARDMAKMARFVIKNYPEYYRYYSLRQFSYQGKTYRNHNRLLGSYDGMDGMKTGYINASGFNLVASAIRNDRRIIGVVFGGRTSRTRNAHMAKLLDAGFARADQLLMAKASIPVPSAKPANSYAMAAQLNRITPAAGYAASPGLKAAVASVEAEVVGGSARENNGRVMSRWAMLNPSFAGDEEQIVGQGDYDPALTKRVQAGLITASAHRAIGMGENDSSGFPLPSRKPGFLTGSDKAQEDDVASFGQNLLNQARSWAIQVGAFSSQQQSTEALKEALNKLPKYYAQAQPIIVPLQTSRNKMYRARLSGYTSQDAYAACAYIQECITIAP